MGAQVIGNSKNAPGSVYDYFDLMFSKQDEIHDYANTGRHFVTEFTLLHSTAQPTILNWLTMSPTKFLRRVQCSAPLQPTSKRYEPPLFSRKGNRKFTINSIRV